MHNPVVSATRDRGARCSCTMDSRGRLSLPGMCDNRDHSFWGSFDKNRHTNHGIAAIPRRGGVSPPAHKHTALASPWRRNHGICTNNVRMQTKRLLLGMEKLSALLTDEVVHKHTSRLPRYCDSQQKRHLSFVQAYKIKKTFKKCVTLSKKRRLYR